MSEDLIRKLWGTDEQYYKELEKFHKEHQNADSITYDNESKVPVSANYYFRPWTVYVDDMKLREAIQQSMIDLGESEGEG